MKANEEVIISEQNKNAALLAFDDMLQKYMSTGAPATVPFKLIEVVTRRISSRTSLSAAALSALLREANLTDTFAIDEVGNKFGKFWNAIPMDQRKAALTVISPLLDFRGVDWLEGKQADMETALFKAFNAMYHLMKDNLRLLISIMEVSPETKATYIIALREAKLLPCTQDSAPTQHS